MPGAQGKKALKFQGPRSCRPLPTAENEFAAEVRWCKCQETPLEIPSSWVQILLQQASDLQCHQEDISQHLPGQRIWRKVRCSQKPVDVSRENLLYRNTFLDSTFFAWKTATSFTVQNGSWHELDIKFLVQSDQLAIVLHFLLAPVASVVKPAEHEDAHRLSPSPGAVSRCFPQNRRSTLCSVGGRTGVWHVNPRVQQTACLRWSARDPGF